MQTNHHAILDLAACLAAALVGASYFPAVAAERPVPFADAVAVWHLGDLEDSAAGGGELVTRGEARAGLEVTGAEPGALPGLPAAAGPWERPKVEVIDGAAARVMKTAAFTDNRRIDTAGLWPHGYAGWAVFRELVQNEDGTLGSRFVPEMIPPAGGAVTLEFQALSDGASGGARQVRIRSAEGTGRAMLSGLPVNARVQLRIDAKAAGMGLRLRAAQDGGEGHELRFVPAERKVRVIGAQSLAEVEGLDKVFSVDIILKDNTLDLCIGGQRTLVNWVPARREDRMVLFVAKGEATFEQITVRPLR